MESRVSAELRQKVMEAIDPDEVAALLVRLVQFASVNPPGEEKQIAEFLAGYMQQSGLQAELQESLPGRPSAIGALSGTAGGPTLVFNGHIDVVPATEGWSFDPFAGILKEGKVYGRGSADMKGGVAAMVAAAKAVIKAGVPLRGDLKLLCAADEESGEAGTRGALERGLKADFAIVPEPTSLEAVIAHKGVVHFAVTTRGKTAHGSTPQLGLNAIEKMLDVVGALDAYKADLARRTHKLVGPATINIGTITGGVKTNVVPDYCRMTIDRRVLPGETVAEAKQEMELVIEKARQKDADLQVEWAAEIETAPMEIAEDEPVVKAIQRAGRQVLGRDVPIGFWPATSDAGSMVNDAGIPTVIFGPGDINMAHKPDEWIDLTEVMQATRIFALSILDLLA